MIRPSAATLQSYSASCVSDSQTSASERPHQPLLSLKGVTEAHRLHSSPDLTHRSARWCMGIVSLVSLLLGVLLSLIIVFGLPLSLSNAVHSTPDFSLLPLSPLTPLSSCPLGHVDVILILRSYDYFLVSHLMRSVDVFMPCYGHLHVFCEDSEERQLRAWMNIHDRVRFHRMVATPPVAHLPGYVLQGWQMMYADQIVEPTATHVMFFDTDSLLGMPVTRRSLFDDEGRTYAPYWAFGDQHTGQPQFIPACEDMIADKCEGSWMAFLPVTFPVSIYAPLRDHIRQRLVVRRQLPLASFDEMLGAWTKLPGVNIMHWSQFVMMGNYQYFYMNHTMHPVFYDVKQAVNTADALNYIPHGVHYGWLPCRYLQSCPPGFDVHLREGLTASYSPKYGARTIQYIQEVIQHGHCMQEFLRAARLHHPTTPAIQLTANFTGPPLLQRGCDPIMLTTIHPLVAPYGAGDHNMSYVYERYAPDEAAAI